MNVRSKDLPDFGSIMDAHQFVQQAALGEDGVDEDLGETAGPFARDYVEGLVSRFHGDSLDAPYVAPLADIVKRVGRLTGVEMPEIDDDESAFSSVLVAGGIDDDG